MSETAAMLAEFHAAFGQPFGHGSPGDSALRRKLHTEEFDELAEAHARLLVAFDTGDLVAVAHELADLVYVAYGSAHSMGIPLDAVLAEVHRANMSKFGADGRPVLREDGKVLKSEHYVRPDVERVLRDTEVRIRERACPVCGQLVPVRSDGALMSHNLPHEPVFCPGSRTRESA